MAANMVTLAEFEDLNTQLIATRKLIREQERLLNLMASLDEQLRESRRRLSRLVTRLKYEKADVQALESLSVEAVFYALLGRREQQLAREAQEYLEVKMETAACRLRIDSLERTLQALQADLVDIVGCEEEYARLQQAQEALIVALGAPESSRLAETLRALAVNVQFQKEVREAVEAGVAALARLTAVTDALLELRSWDGVWSMEFAEAGNGRFAQVFALAHEAQPLLDRFQAELVDVERQFFSPLDMRIPAQAAPTLVTLPGALLDLFFPEAQVPGTLRDWYTYLTQLQRRLQLRLDLLQESLQAVDGRLLHLRQQRADLVAACWAAERFGG